MARGLCKICGAFASCKYFGATSCQSCKIFFRRNAKRGLETFKCSKTSQCPIDVLNRRLCPSCRLKKCFISGMRTELIRCSREKQQTVNQIHVTSTSNLLVSKPSDLTIEQWNSIWKLSDSYQDNQTFRHLQDFVQEQISLPIKQRLKLPSINRFFECILSGFEFFFQSNAHLCTLSLHDRSRLLRCTMENTSYFTAIVLLLQAHVFDHPYVQEFLENIYESSVITTINDLRDPILIKLSVALLTFSSTSSTTNRFDHWQNFSEIRRFENLYTELIWKYLLGKYDHSRAMICFDRLIKTILHAHQTIAELHQSQLYTSMIDNLLVKMYHRLIVSLPNKT